MLKGMRLTAIDNEMLVVVCQDERTLYRLSVDDFQDQDEEEISRDQIAFDAGQDDAGEGRNSIVAVHQTIHDVGGATHPQAY